MPIAKPLLERCTDPYATRRRADRGLDVPCPTGCFAYEPLLGRECWFVNRGVRFGRPKVEPEVSPLRVARQAPGQLDLMFPTADVGPEQGDE